MFWICLLIFFSFLRKILLTQCTEKLFLDDAFDHVFSCILSIEHCYHTIRRDWRWASNILSVFFCGYSLKSSLPDQNDILVRVPHVSHITYVDIKQNDISVWTLTRNPCIKFSSWCSCNICEYKAKQNVCLNTHKKSMH